MVMGTVVERFVEQTPITVMARLVFHCQKGAVTQILARHLFTDFVRLGFRETPDFMRIADRRLQNHTTIGR